MNFKIGVTFVKFTSFLTTAIHTGMKNVPACQ